MAAPARRGNAPRQGKIPLPGGGTATIRDASQLTGRQRRPMELAGARMGPVLDRLQRATRVLVEGEVFEDRSGEVDKRGRRLYTGPDVDLTEKQFERLARINDALAWALLESWTLDLELPESPDDLLDLPGDLYDTLIAAAIHVGTGAVLDAAPADLDEPAAAPDPAEARVVVAYTNLNPETAQLLDEHAPGHIRVEIDPTDMEAYWRLLADEWTRPGDLVVVEQDIAIHADVLPGFASCRQPWCGHPYPIGMQNWIGLGCTRFTSALKQAEPDLFEVVGRPDDDQLLPARDWRHLDPLLSLELKSRGYVVHSHTPTVGHLRDQTQEETWRRLALPPHEPDPDRASTQASGEAQPSLPAPTS
ncbi:MAG TPA: hypothetical protein VGL39_07635 [Jatrophihabitantaceae bacterium]